MIEEEDFEVVSLIIQGFLITILCIFGIIGSILSALVLTHREMRSAVSSLLIGLTVSDTIFILGQFQMVGIYYIVHYLSPESYYVTHFQPFSLPYWWYASSLAQTAGLCFAVSITVERYIAIRYPFYAKIYCTWRQANFVSILILAFSSIYALPNLFAFETILLDNVTNTYSIYPTEFGQSDLFGEYYDFWANMVVHVFIPFTILIILNLIIITRMRSARKIRLNMTTGRASCTRRTKQVSNNNTTNMLICIVIIFSICYTPVTIYRVWDRAVSPTDWTDSEQEEFYHQHSFNLFVLLTIGRVTVTTNSSMNFIIYCVMGKKFRGLLCKIFHLKQKKTNQRILQARQQRFNQQIFRMVKYGPPGQVLDEAEEEINNEDEGYHDDDEDDNNSTTRRPRSMTSYSEDGF